MLCVGLLCTPTYATNIPETTAVHAVEQTTDQHMTEETSENKEETFENEASSESDEEMDSNSSEITKADTEKETEANFTEVDEEQLSENNEDMISIVETQSGVDADGFVTMNISVAENVTLPVTVTMKSEEGTFSFTVAYQEQPVKLKPGNYHLTKVVDGSNQELDNGANLSIPEENGEVYLDFTKPEEKKEESLFSKFIATNLIFIPIAGALWLLYQWWMKHH